MAAALAEAALPTEAAAPAAKGAAPAPARPMPACKNCGRRADRCTLGCHSCDKPRWPPRV
eukprot:5700205-Prymnesium_polylepis.1